MRSLIKQSHIMLIKNRTENKIHFVIYHLPAIIIMLLLIFMCTQFVLAEDNGLPADYIPDEADNRDLSDNTGQNRYGIPWHQFKNILTGETVDTQPVAVLCEPEDDWSDPEPVQGLVFRVYNSTTQETEAVISTDDQGKLYLPALKRGHTYILMAESDRYLIDGAQNIYLWALAEGDQGVSEAGAYEHKTKYKRLEDDDPVPDPADYLVRFSEIMVKEVAGSFYDPMFYTMKLPVTYNGTSAPDGIRFRFTSPDGSEVEAVTSEGYVTAELIEDTDYTVHVDDDTYGINTFALSVKDKSEHKYTDEITGSLMSYKRYCYDHTCCQGVSEIKLIDKTSVSVTGTISSLKKYNNTGTPQTTIKGMNFKTLLLLVRYPSIKLPAGSGVTDYDVVELTLANPHRWEKCKITDTVFTVTQKLPQKRTVKKVYQLSGENLYPLSFSQSGKDTVVFSMDSMSLYPVVIEYAEEEPDTPDTNVTPANVTPAAPASAPVRKAAVSKPKGTKIKKLKPGRKKITVVWKKQTKNTTGYQIQYSTKKSFKKAKTIKVKGSKKTSKVIKKLKSGKRYYVRIRTYRTVKGKKYVSSWSKRKSVKVS